MQIDVNEDGLIRLKEVFNPVEFVSPDGEVLIVCMRDGGFEIASLDTSHKPPDGKRYFTRCEVKGGVIKEFHLQAKNEQ